MTTQQIQRLREKQPFEPFRLHVADGQSYDVRHPENYMITGNGRILAIALPDAVITLDLLLVTAIEQPIRARGRGAMAARAEKRHRRTAS